MGTPEDVKSRAAAAYNAAADTYDDPANSFWEHYGRRSVDRLALRPGARVLDVCCGSGASALPAADAVGSGGFVLGVDLAENLLALARSKAGQRGLDNVEFRSGDLLELGLPAADFDAVVCVFGIFFVPDMQAAVGELWRLVRPGGRLAITTWGPRFFEPVNTVFWNAVRDVRPDLYKAFNPWERVNEPATLRALLSSSGVPDAAVVAESGSHSLRAAEDWWPMVRGSGYRGTLEQLDSAARERIRTACLDFIRAQGVRSVGANVVYAVAAKEQA